MASRRRFIQGLCAIPVLQSLPLPGERVWYRASQNAIEAVRTVNGRNYKLQSVPSEKPGCLTYHRNRQVLFAVNEINEYDGLPRGSVESYHADSSSGLLSLLSRQPLSLSAISPRRLVVSPDDRCMVVAAYGGGAYNVLPVGVNGELGPVSQIVKEVGSGPHPEEQRSAHPHSLVFHPSGRFVVTTDFGADRIHVFAFSDGRMSRVSSVRAPSGSGPAGLSAHWPRLEVAHKLAGTSSCYRFDSETGRLTCIS